MNSKVNILPNELELASTIAKSFASKWKLVDVNDLEGHLFLWLVEHEADLIRFRDDGNDGRLYVSLRREASRYCVKETKQVANVDEMDNNNFYNIDMVYRALPFLFEYDTVAAEMSNDVTGLGHAIMTDINSVYHGLPSDVKQILSLRYRDGLTFQQISEAYDITLSAAEKRVERAVHRLYNALSGTPVQWYEKEVNKISYEEF